MRAEKQQRAQSSLVLISRKHRWNGTGTARDARGRTLIVVAGGASQQAGANSEHRGERQHRRAPHWRVPIRRHSGSAAARSCSSDACRASLQRPADAREGLGAIRVPPPPPLLVGPIMRLRWRRPGARGATAGSRTYDGAARSPGVGHGTGGGSGGHAAAGSSSRFQKRASAAGTTGASSTSRSSAAAVRPAPDDAALPMVRATPLHPTRRRRDTQQPRG